MFTRKKEARRFFYCYDDQLNLQEVKWVRVKLAGLVGALLVVCLAGTLLINRLFDDALGLGRDRVDALTRENALLQNQLSEFVSRVGSLESAIRRLNDEGNHMRLLVDLPVIDDATRTAGTGGAATELAVASSKTDASVLLESVGAQLAQLGSEIRVQEQSYGEIVRKYEFNKEFFNALPALKPMEGFYASREFGVRMHPVLGIFKTHEGLDIVNDVGTPVYAAADGVVELAGQSGGGYGIVVVIRHGFGFQTLYAHLSKVLVRAGQRVSRGSLLAKSGKTGLVSGPHLHYEVRRNGVCQNPVDYFFDDVTARDYRAQVASR